MSPVLATAPHWQRRVESLRRKDIANHLSLERLRDGILLELPAALLSAASGCQLQHWMRSLGAHRQDECRLLQEAFTLDIGGEA